MIALVDYGAGNVRSVARALEAVGGQVKLTSDPAQVVSADRLVFPGQGHFGQSMARLRRTGLGDAIRESVQLGRPFLGICLGLQLLFEASDEAPGVDGLGLLRGTCRRFAPPLNVPQIGWNRVECSVAPPPLSAATGQHFYFVHSYHAVARDPEDVVAWAEYGGKFTAAVQRGNLLATQFHPEKSGRSGLALLRAWLERPC